MELVAPRSLVKMSQSLKLRALLNERLSAVAEDILQLFERTMAEYEEELLRPKGEDYRRTELKESAEDRSKTAGDQIISSCRRKESPIRQVNLSQIYIKEDPDLCIKQEEEESLAVTMVSVKVDEGVHISSVYQQTEENRREIIDQQTGTRDNSSVVGLGTAGHSSNALFVIGTNSSPQNVHPQTLYYSDLTSAVPNRDKSHLPAADSEKEQKLHKCAQCAKVYHHSSSLFRHILTHREQKPFRCPVCQKGFSQKPHLKAHMRIHTGERPFSCPFCARTFSNKSNLGQHLRVHTGEKPFTCSVCNMRFSCMKTLTTHSRIHTGDRPFRCPHCDRWFKHQTTFDSHLRMHSGEKPYSCTMCEKTFAQQRSLKNHLMAHTEQEIPGPGGDSAAVNIASVQDTTNEMSQNYITVSI